MWHQVMSNDGSANNNYRRCGSFGLLTFKNRPAHRLAGVRKRDAHYSSRRAPYDAANQQIQFNAASPNQTFDANGNLQTQTDTSGTTTYTWDARNRLTAISGPSLSASFSYDALGRRISKTINGVTTSFLYDGNDIVQEIGGGAVGASYVRSLNIDEPFIRPAGSNEFYHTDALGSTLALTNQAAAVQTSYSHEAFGKTTISGPSTNPFQYTGRENDGTGLYYYRARYFSPQLHRFITEDPFGFNGGAFNLFAYALNNPLSLGDPFGLTVLYLNGNRPPSDPEMIEKLDALDRAVGERDVIVDDIDGLGGTRTLDEQMRTNLKAPDSFHTKGAAADVKVFGLTSEQLAEKSAEVGFKGISTYDSSTRIHVDTRKTEWNAHNSVSSPDGVRPQWRIEGEKKAMDKRAAMGRRK